MTHFARLVALAVALHTAACARLTPPRPESRFLLRVEGQPDVQVSVLASPLTVRQERHWIEGSRMAISHHLRILGRAPAPDITIIDRAASREFAADPGVIPVSAPFLTSDRGMQIEAAIARSVARAFWHAAIACDDTDGGFIEGLSRYTSTVALVSQYDGLRAPPAVGMYEQRWLGDLMPWVVRIEQPAWTAPPRTGDARAIDAARTALAMQTLANRIGKPTFEAALRTLAAGPRSGCASWRDLQAAVNDVTGLDLSWFFEPAFTVRRVFDYGVDALETSPAPRAGEYRTRVVARRYGDAMFTGTSVHPVAPFEAGRGVELRVRFADGAERVDYWDGRAERREFEYESASPAVSATIDPRTVIQLDSDRTNNSRTLAPKSGVAATKWSARWMLWLQSALLSYSSLV